MAAEATKSSGSADSFIGSFISLTSKSAIRYEGFLFHINPDDSTIGLRNVKSFGTEGRRVDGSHILPSDKVYDYIYFRGTDIKDLQVVSSPTVQSTTDVPDDPAVIQLHYPQSTSLSARMSDAGAAFATIFKSNAESGLPTSTFQEKLPRQESVGNLGSWSLSASPPTANSNGLVLPTYWPGLRGSFEGVSHLQQQSFVRPPQGLAVPPLVQQQMQYPSISASLPDSNSLPQFSYPLIPPVYTGSPNIASAGFLPSNLPSEQSYTTASNLSPNMMDTFFSVPPASSSPLVLQSTPSSLDAYPVAPFIEERPKSVLSPTLPPQNILQHRPSISESSSVTHSEAFIPHLVTPGQLLQPGFKTPPSICSLQTAHKDIEVVQAPKSELPSFDFKKVQDTLEHIPLPSSEKVNIFSLDSPLSDQRQTKDKEDGLIGGGSNPLQSSRGCLQGRGRMLNGGASHTFHNSNIGHAKGRGNKLMNGAALYPHSDRRHSWGRKNAHTGVPQHAHFSHRGRGRGRGAQDIHKVAKFTEDFDFEAMNEKFNKEEVWGHLGKRYKAEEKESDDGQEDDGDYGLRKTDFKPVYVKDDFFDSLSSNTPDHHGSGRGRAKISEQKKIDTETFGELPRNWHGRGGGRRGWGPGRGGRFQGSYRGRGYGYAGRGSGRTVWSRVT